MTIAEASRKYGLSADALRYYERVGLIPRVPRTKSGIRDYDEASCGWIELTKCLRSAGVQIEALIQYSALFQQGEETVGERPCLRLACDLPDDEGTVYTTWFDQETLLPLRSEISAEGTVVFEVAWTRFEVTGGGEPAAPAVPAEPGAPQEGTSDWTAADEAAAYASAEE